MERRCGATERDLSMQIRAYFDDDLLTRARRQALAWMQACKMQADYENLGLWDAACGPSRRRRDGDPDPAAA